MNYKSFVITLPEAKARQEHITKTLGAQDVEFEFFNAVDGRGFDVPLQPIYHATKRRLFFGRDMTGGEIGVLLSHKSLYQKIVDEQIDMSLIFEDDVRLNTDFKSILDALLTGTRDFDVVRFLGSQKNARVEQYIKRPVTGIYTLNRMRTTPGGAHAYLITLEGARKMLQILDRVYLPIDTLLGHNWLNGLRAYVVQKPGLATQDAEQEQYIGTQRFDKTTDTQGIVRLVYPISRIGFKTYEGFMKALTYYKYMIADK